VKIYTLSKKYYQYKYSLKTINLDGTRLRDRGAIELLDGLQNSPKIKSINISRNELTDGISETIFTYLS
jgi:hypothetical protein